jgi:hypothetical protein
MATVMQKIKDIEDEVTTNEPSPGYSASASRICALGSWFPSSRPDVSVDLCSELLRVFELWLSGSFELEWFLMLSRLDSS